MLTAEVISIGDELTSGQRLDTNSQWLSLQLGDLGLRVAYHTTVADELEANVRVFRQAVERADVVIATGGLGPTADDLTRFALAELAQVELQLDEPSLAHIRQLFTTRGRPMPDANTIQAQFPRGSQPIHNPHGTAPGIAIQFPRPGGATCHVFALPGVPAEMKEMWPAVEHELRQRGLATRIIRHRQIKCFGVGESDLEAMLPDLIRRGRAPQVGITVSGATITLRITAAGHTEEECRAAIAPTAETIYRCVGTLAFGEGDDELEHAVARLLKQRRQKLATIEWGTAGQIAHWLANAAEHSGCLTVGHVLGDAATAARVLGVPPQDLAVPECSEEFVRLLSAAAKQHSGADYALAVGPFPPAETAAENGRIHLALATPHELHTRSVRYAAHPAIVQVRVAKQALDFVRLTLLKSRTET
jgi:nicotinamide-nucleotide amidase